MEPKTKIQQDLLTRLRRQLPHGAGREIAEALDKSRNYVSMVLHGKAFNKEIIDMAIAIRNREIEYYNQLIEEI